MTRFFLVFVSLIFAVSYSYSQNDYRDIKRLDSLISRLNNHTLKTETANETVQHYAAMFYINATIHGYNSKEAMMYLKKCEEKIDSFGYGLGFAWDAFQDGTVNDVSTNYSITITEHMLPLIYGYEHKVVDKARIIHMIEAYKKFPLADSLANGDCIAYSDHKNDIVGCVHNTNISCAKFIERIKRLGMADRELKKQQKRIIQREISSFVVKDTNYYYWDKDSIPCDQNHIANSALQMYDLQNPELQRIALLLTEKVLRNKEKNVMSLIGQCALLSINDAHYNEMYKVIDDLLKNKSDYVDFHSYKFNNAQISSNINYFLCLLKEKWIKKSK